jgi:hypothetical protein
LIFAALRPATQCFNRLRAKADAANLQMRAIN